jgi:hypothetical protein
MRAQGLHIGNLMVASLQSSERVSIVMASLSRHRVRDAICIAIVLALYVKPILGQSISDRSGVDLTVSASFSKPIASKIISKSLREVVNSLSQATSVPMSVADKLALRRVSLFTTRATLSEQMDAIAMVGGLAWKRNEGDAGACHLYQPEEAEKIESALISSSHKREERVRALEEQGVLQAIKDMPRNNDLFTSFVTGLSSDVKQQAATLASEPMGVITTTGSHQEANIFASVAFTDLSASMQTQFVGRMKQLSDPRNLNEYRLVPGKSQSSFKDSRIALVARDGAVRLGVISGDREIWVDSGTEVRRKHIRGIYSDTPMPLEVEEAYYNGPPILDISEMPAALRTGKRLKFGQGVDKMSLTQLLQYISEQCDISIVADDFYLTRRPYFHWVLSGKEEYTVEEALKEVAAAFGRRMAYKNGVLRVWTVCPGLDLRSELPASLITRLTELGELNKHMDTSDFLKVAQLDRLQFDTLSRRKPEGVTQNREIFRIQQFYRVLNFYATLSNEERESCLTSDGLAFDTLDAEHKRKFKLIDGVGRNVHAIKPGSKRPGIYAANVKSGQNRETLVLSVVSPGSRRETRYDIPIRE